MDEYRYDKWTRSTTGFSNYTCPVSWRCDVRLDNGRHCTEPEKDLGLLDSLPLEILVMILARVDLRTITHFRRVNQRAMQVVNSIPEYVVIMEHCAKTLRYILAIETASYVSCLDLFHALQNPFCDECGDLGELIYLLTCKRICNDCSGFKSRYLPLLASEAMREFGLSQHHLKSIPRMRNLPGFESYRRRSRQYRGRHTFLDPESVYSVALSVHEPALFAEPHVTKVSSEAIDKFKKKLSREPDDKHWPNGCQRPTLQKGRRQMENMRRVMAVVDSPWLNPSTNAPERPVYCNGCSFEWRTRYEKFTKASFVDHIKKFGEIENGRHCPPSSIAAGEQQ